MNTFVSAAAGAAKTNNAQAKSPGIERAGMDRMMHRKMREAPANR
jgi:hypothetical protein